MLSKILVPVDGSENSFRALEHAIFLSRKIEGTQTTVTHIIEGPPSVYIYSPKVMEKVRADYKSESTKILERCKDMANKSGINIHTVLIEGDPASKIIRYSEMEKFDIIIIGSRGMGQFKEMILGSISNKVLHHAKCSVMVVR
ncbi:MAG TPA: universal stress protein [Nitrososphaeraceae archaeon]|jgi:nucleotide-binding universal stress UspA family protein|nr:universal stress protein [Nitrososphaeraceae archaeon]